MTKSENAATLAYLSKRLIEAGAIYGPGRHAATGPAYTGWWKGDVFLGRTPREAVRHLRNIGNP